VGQSARPAVVNLGWRPTFAEQGLAIEVHILDFCGDLYGRTLEIELVRHLRDEQRFASAEALVAQLSSDVEYARTVLAEDAPVGAHHQTEV
jgi:riboflavin kinase/FMN adenylyltransferase